MHTARLQEVAQDLRSREHKVTQNFEAYSLWGLAFPSQMYRECVGSGRASRTRCEKNSNRQSPKLEKMPIKCLTNGRLREKERIPGSIPKTIPEKTRQPFRQDPDLSTHIRPTWTCKACTKGTNTPKNSQKGHYSTYLGGPGSPVARRAKFLL